MSPSTSAFLLLLPLGCATAIVLSLRLLRREAWSAGQAASPATRRAVTLLLAGVAFLAALQLHNAYGLKTDDAPITFRYAENVASGRGFVYNPGERVLGTSAPLFVLALAALRLCGVPVETSALLLNLAALAAVVSLVLRMGRRIAGEASSLLAAALLGTEAPFLVYATQGMETTCYVAVILGSLCCYLEGKERAAAGLAAICTVMRLDGLAVAAALGLTTLARRRLPSRSSLLVFAAVAAPWFAFSQLYFGSVLPQSMIAKIHHAKYSDPRWMLRSLLLDGTLLFVPFGLLGVAGVLRRRDEAPRVPGPAGEGEAVALSNHCREERLPGLSPGAVLPVWLALYAGAFSIVPIDAYPWYRLPPVPVLALLAGAGLHAAAAGWLRFSSSVPGAAVGAGAAASTGAAIPHAVEASTPLAAWALPTTPSRTALLVLAVAVLPWGAGRYLSYRDSLAAYWEQLRVWETPRVATAEWLREHAPPGSTVCTSAIGHIGWISGLRILDTSGLVTPRLPVDLGRERPEFIVGHDGDPRPGAVFTVEDARYQLVRSLAVERDVVYRIYKRNDVLLR